jgi:hypothetical protein
MGSRGLAWLATRPGYGGYAIDARLQPAWTAGLGALLRAANLGDPSEAATTA